MPFASLVGNAALGARLRAMAASGRVPPSLLFVGPKGVGKLAAARVLAKALNCERKDGDACDACATCLRIERGDHADVRVLRPEGKGGQITIEPVEELVREAHFRPFEGRRKVYIVSDADRMNPTASNKILKLLEEPPPWLVFILVTANEGTMPPTLLSRCQILRFAPLSVEELASLLVERPDIDPERATALAALAGGSLEEALALIEEPIEELRAKALRLAEVVGGPAPERDLVPLADALSKEERLLLLLRILMGLFRDAASRLGGGSLVNRDLEGEIDRLSRAAPLETWLAAYRLAEEALEDLRDRYLNKRITLGRLVVSLSGLR